MKNHTPMWWAIRNQMDHDPNHEKHGTRNGYNNYQCRCRKCSLANANYQATVRRRAQESGYTMGWKHGTWSTYSNYLCRCQPCTEAAAKYNRERRRKSR
jgi:hypothetical protein